MAYRLRRVKDLRVKKPEVVLARLMEEMMHEAGMPKGCDRATFSTWHDRLYATDEVYRESHGQLMELLRARAAKDRL